MRPYITAYHSRVSIIIISYCSLLVAAFYMFLLSSCFKFPMQILNRIELNSLSQQGLFVFQVPIIGQAGHINHCPINPSSLYIYKLQLHQSTIWSILPKHALLIFRQCSFEYFLLIRLLIIVTM